MRKLYRHLPSPSALLAFEAAARHRSFTRAAEELYVSQAAVSRQIRRLEERLGVRLFDRMHRRVELTWAGEKLYQAVSHGLDHIAETAIQIRQIHHERHITVAANNAVAFYWLRPRVTAFRQAHQETELHVLASDDDLELGEQAIDIAVRYGDGNWPGVEKTLLFEEDVFPVCSPGYLARHGALERPLDLLSTTLLHMEPRTPDWITWTAWLRAHDVDAGTRMPVGLTFNSYPILLQAAIEGQGVAIGTRYLVDSLVDGGGLVRPLRESYRTGRGYYLVTPAEAPPSRSVLSFRRWLLKG